jgi:hypothetical protein
LVGRVVDTSVFAELLPIRSGKTPKATIDAVLQAVCERGLRALDESTTARRLAVCDANARSEIKKRISSIFGEK